MKQGEMDQHVSHVSLVLWSVLHMAAVIINRACCGRLLRPSSLIPACQISAYQHSRCSLVLIPCSCSLPPSDPRSRTELDLLALR